jgi:uncharacterized protein YdaU (DUF1376 family)
LLISSRCWFWQPSFGTDEHNSKPFALPRAAFSKAEFHAWRGFLLPMKRPSFQFYPADWLSDMRVRMLPWECRGLYMDLLCYCWREGWIPADGSAIAQLSGCHSLAIIEPCLLLFQSHPKDPSKLIHKRLEEEKMKQDHHRKERSSAGAKGAKARWNKGKSTDQGGDGSAMAQPSICHGSAIDLPLAKNDSSTSSTTSTSKSFSYQKNSKGEAVSELAQTIWDGTPKLGRERSSRADLQKALHKIPAAQLPDIEIVKAALHQWRESESWKKDGGAFVPGIHRWVTARQWENIPEAAQSTHGRNHAGIQEDIPF